MSWWRKLFGGIAEAATDATAEPGQDSMAVLKTVAFRFTASSIEPPVGNLGDDQKDFLPRLRRGREQAVKFRRDFLANKPFLKDPVDQPVRNRYSLAVLFDWDKMESDYGRQVFQAFFQQILPHGIRFLTADKQEWMIEPAIKNTAWRL